MATIIVEGRKVQVDDSFMSLSPDQQNATVDEIAKSLGAAPPPEAQQQVSVDPQTMQPPGVPEFNPGVAGYDPKTGNVTQDATGTFMTAGAEGVPIIGGVLDKGVLNASAGLGSLISGQPFSQTKGQMQTLRDQSREAHPIAHVAGNMAGGVVATAPLAATGLGAKAFGLAPGMSLPARVGASAATNAAISGADTAARGGDARDIAGSAAIGAGVGGAMPLVAKGVSAVVDKAAGAFNRKPAALGVDDLKAAATSAYDRAEQAGVAFNGQGVNSLRSNIIKDLTDHGFDPANEPGVMPVIRRLQEIGNGNITLKGLDTLRKVASNGFVPGNQSNNAAITKIIGRIDELVTKSDPSTVLMGDAKAGSQALREARKLWSSGKKLETVNELLERAGLNAGSSGSGGNVENATRQQLKRLLTNPNLKRGLSTDEQAAARKAVLGSRTQNALRLAGKLSPQGNGLMLAIGSAGTIANPAVGIPAMVAGYGAKKTSEYLSRKSVGELVNLIAHGGDASTLPVIKNAVQLLAESKKMALARALTVAGFAGANALMINSGAK